MPLVNYVAGDGVGHIELNRPEAANAFDIEAARQFAAVISRASQDHAARAVLISGAGPRFCAGGDVTSFATASDVSAYVHQLAVELDGAFRSLHDLQKPVVAAVRGAVAGAGLALILSCDVVIADIGTKFVFAYPGIGITPDCGLSYLLPRAIGQQRALAFSLIGRSASASEALSWGLVSEVAEDAESRSRNIARNWADGPATAMGQVRRLFRQSWERDRAETGREEARTVSDMVRGPESRRLIADFVRRHSQ